MGETELAGIVGTPAKPLLMPARCGRAAVRLSVSCHTAKCRVSCVIRARSPAERCTAFSRSSRERLRPRLSGCSRRGSPLAS